MCADRDRDAIFYPSREVFRESRDDEKNVRFSTPVLPKNTSHFRESIDGRTVGANEHVISIISVALSSRVDCNFSVEYANVIHCVVTRSSSDKAR